MAERHISILKPFHTGDVTEWFQRFEICCAANTWNDEVKAFKLPTLLEGEALAIWLELSDDDNKDYKKTKEHLLKSMMPMEFISLDKFHQRKLRPVSCCLFSYMTLRNCQVELCQGLRLTRVSNFCFTSFWWAYLSLLACKYMPPVKCLT